MNPKGTRFFVVLAVMLSGILLGGNSAYLWGKATLAQWLIQQSWNKNKNSLDAKPPWPWADTKPVAALDIGPDNLMVLAGATGRVLAFGPGWLMSSASPGELGNTVVLGHRDTHFEGLQHVSVGDYIHLTTPSGKLRYQIEMTDIVHMHDTRYLESDSNQVLTLITCYPFNQLTPDTPWRFVVRAVATQSARPTPIQEYVFL